MCCGSLFFNSCTDSVIFLLEVASISDFIRGHPKYIADDAEHTKCGKKSNNPKLSPNREF